MEFYIILLSFIMLCLFLNILTPKVGYVMLIVLFTVLAFRGETVGTDTSNYLNHYYNNYAEGASFNMKHIELGYVFLLFLLKKLSLGPQSVLIFMSFLTFLFLYLSIRKSQSSLVITLFYFVIVGFYLFSFNGSRQILAVSILLYGYVKFIYNDNHNRIYFVIYFICACLFHNSILTLFPILLIPTKKLSGFFIFTLFTVGIIFFTLGLNPLFGKLRVFIESIFFTYQDLLDYSSSTSFNGKLYYLVIFIFQVAVIYISKNRYNTKLFNLFIVSVFAFLVMKNMHPYISRLIFAFSIIQVIYYTKFMTDKTIHLATRVIICTPLIILLCYSQYDVLISNIGEIIPYCSSLK